MAFWSYIGLATKKDIDNINSEIKEIKNLINMNIQYNDQINKKNNELEKSIVNGFAIIENNINNLNLQVEKQIKEFDNKNIFKHQELNKTLKEIDDKTSKYNEYSKEQINSLINSLKPIYSEIIECKKVNDDNFTQNYRLLKNLEQSITTTFSTTKDNVNNLILQLEGTIKELGNNTTLKQDELIKVINKANINISKSKEHIINLENSLKPIYSEIIESKKDNNDKLTENNKILNNLIKEFKRHKKNVESLDKDISIIQQMIKVVWVNDIVDTLENQNLQK